MSKEYEETIYWQTAELVKKEAGWILGNFSYFPKKCEVLYDTVKALQPRNILEVGFNCGHSCAIMLSASPHSVVYTFDIGGRDYITKAAKAFSQIPGVSFLYTAGDSAKTVPAWIATVNDVIDFALIDGAHTYEAVKIDLANVIPKISVGGILFLDDTEIPGIKKAIDETDFADFALEGAYTCERFTKDKFSDIMIFRRVK